MQPTERIEVRKIYVGSAALFGVYCGLIVGLIAAIFVLISGLVIRGGIDLGFYQIYTLQGLFAVAGLVFIVKFILVFVFMVLGSLIYNLVARMGARVSIGLAEYEKPPKKMRREKEKQDKKMEKAMKRNELGPRDQKKPGSHMKLPDGKHKEAPEPDKSLEKEDAELQAARKMIRKMSMT